MRIKLIKDITEGAVVESPGTTVAKWIAAVSGVE